MVCHQINPDYRSDCCSYQCRIGCGDGVAVDPFRLSRQAVADHPARFAAVFRIARGGRFDVRLYCSARIRHWAAGEAQGIQIIFAIPALFFLRRCSLPSSCRARNHSFNAGAGRQRRTGCANTRRKRLADVLARYPPNIKWALLYGIILTNARAMGEFGAVSVVSGHIRGETNTIPLLVEIFYNEYIHRRIRPLGVLAL